MGNEPTLVQIAGQLRRVIKRRFAEGVMGDRDIGQGRWCRNADAQRFSQRFLGGKTFGKKTRWILSA